MKVIILLAIALGMYSGAQEKMTVQQRQRFQKKLLDLKKEFFLDAAGSKPASGNWEGTMLSLDESGACHISLTFMRKTTTALVTGICSIRYAHWLNWESIPEINEKEDSLRSLKDPEPWRKYIKKKIDSDNAAEASYNEFYNISGSIRGDSLYFQIDTVYPKTEKRPAAKERHLRFQAKCMKWVSPYSIDAPNYFLSGNYVDSAFQLFPGYGNFMMYKQR